MSSAADVLFSRTHQRLLFALFCADAAEGLSYAELLRRTAGGSGAIHRELEKFLAAGLIAQRRVGGRRLFAANPGHPAYGELASLAIRLLGAPPARGESARRRSPGRLDAATARSLARKYLWWQAPADAVKNQERLVAQVMNIGDYGDVQQVARQLGNAYLRKVLKNAEPGQLDERSRAYWSYRLGLARPGEARPLPARTPG